MILLTSDKTVVFSACDLFDMDFKMVCSVSNSIKLLKIYFFELLRTTKLVNCLRTIFPGSRYYF